MLCVPTLLWWHSVSTNVVPEDRVYLDRLLTAASVDRARNRTDFAAELVAIRAVQRTVLVVAPGDSGIPYNRQREPRDLYEVGAGECYDRSRSIEQALRYAGFRVRHVFLLSMVKHGAFGALVMRQVRSHAVTEVLTSRGWLVVDSNAPWVSLDHDGHPVSIADITTGDVVWDMEIPDEIYKGPVLYVYGLYSHHGRFYPPYGWLPDVNYGELLEHF